MTGMPPLGRDIIVDPTESPVTVTGIWFVRGNVHGFTTARWNEELRGWYDGAFWSSDPHGVQVEWRLA